MRGRIASEGEQRRAQSIRLGYARARGDFNRAVETILNARISKHSDKTLRQHSQKICKRRRAVAQRLNEQVGIEARQHAGWPGKADNRSHQASRPPVERRFDCSNLRRGVSEGSGGRKADRIRGVRRSRSPQ